MNMQLRKPYCVLMRTLEKNIRSLTRRFRSRDLSTRDGADNEMSARMNCRRFHIHDSAVQSFSSLQSTVQRTWRPPYARGAVLERDYCPAWLLSEVESEQLKDLLIFKGGTAIKRYPDVLTSLTTSPDVLCES